MSTNHTKEIYFGPFEVAGEVFYQTKFCYAIVNIKPILPGHTLVIPFRPVPRLVDLSAEEITDLFTSVQKVQKMLARTYFRPSSSSASAPASASLSASSSSSSPSAPGGAGGGGTGRVEDGSFNVAIQDGRESGQTVPHVHCHIIPRTRTDPVKGDQIYDLLQGEEGNVGGGLWDAQRPKPIGKFPPIEDEDRKPRSKEEMAEEASFFRAQMALVE